MIDYFSSQNYIQNGVIQASFRQINRNWQLHRHQYYELEIFLSGEGKYCIDNESYQIRRGELFLMSPTSFHSIEKKSMASPMELISIIFSFEICDADIINNVFFNSSYIYAHLSEDDIAFISTLTRELMTILHGIANISESKHYFYVKALLNCILGKVRSIVGESSQFQKTLPVQCAMLYIQNHFKEPLTLETISKVINYSPNYFNYKFRECVGMTFKQYLSDIRFSMAKRLLENTNMSIAAIGAECGFRDASNFSLGFKKKYGMSPLYYREKRKMNDGKQA